MFNADHFLPFCFRQQGINLIVQKLLWLKSSSAYLKSNSRSRMGEADKIHLTIYIGTLYFIREIINFAICISRFG